MTNTTSPIAQVTLLEHLAVNGPATVTTLMQVVALSETGTRKLLKRLESEGKVIKTGREFSLVIDKPLPKKSASGTSHKREEVKTRDRLVHSYLCKLDADATISRDRLVKWLNADGHKVSGSYVYLSLFRLHQAGEIERVHVGKRAPEWRVLHHR